MNDSSQVGYSPPKRVTVYIEYCINCESHQWCTNHKSDKYLGYLNQVKRAINETVPECYIIENDLPPEKADRLIKTYNSITQDNVAKYKPKKGPKSCFPRIGAFEVYIKHKTIFSKLKHGMWPHAEKLAAKLRAVVDNLNNGKPILKDIPHRDMSESDPEETPRELANPKSSFVIPKVPKALRKKKRKSKKLRNHKQGLNHTAYGGTDSEDNQLQPKGITKEKANSEDDYEDDFDEDKNSDGYGQDEDFEDDPHSKPEEDKDKDKETRKKIIKRSNRKKYQTNNPRMHDNSHIDLSGNKYSTKAKRSKVSLFNHRFSGTSKPRRDRGVKNKSQIRNYQNLNHSAHIVKKSRPRTYGNRSHLNSSDHAHSFSNLPSYNKKRKFKSGK